VFQISSIMVSTSCCANEQFSSQRGLFYCRALACVVNIGRRRHLVSKYQFDTLIYAKGFPQAAHALHEHADLAAFQVEKSCATTKLD